MSLSKRFIAAFQWNVIGQVTLTFLGIVYSAFIARSLGPEDYGVYVSIFAVVGIVFIIIKLGMERIINVKIPELSAQSSGVREGNIVYFVRKLFLYRLISLVVAGVILCVYAPEITALLHKEGVAGYLRPVSLYVVFMGLIGFFSMIFRAQLKVKLTKVLEILQQVAALLTAFILLRGGLALKGAVYAPIVASVLILAVYLFLSKHYLFGKAVKFKVSGLYQIGLTAWLLGFVSYILGKQSDILLLNYFKVSSSDIGFYNIAFMLTVTLGFFGIGLGPIFQSVFSETYARKGRQGLADSWNISARITLLLSIPFYTFAMLYAPSIITIIYGAEYQAASTAFRLFALLHLLYLATNVTSSTSAFYLINKKRVALCLRVSAGIINLVLNIILIPRYGIFAAIFATGFSTMLMGLLEFVVINREIKAKLPLVFYSKIFVVFSIALLPTLLVGGSGMIVFVLKGFIYGISSLGLMMLLKPIEKQDKQFVKAAHRPLYMLIKRL